MTKKARDTSAIAGSTVDKAALRALVWETVRQSGGATCDEVEVLLHQVHQTISPRFTELSRKGRIRDSGQRRLTRSRRPAIVWKAVLVLDSDN
jgi:hypothetical protein